MRAEAPPKFDGRRPAIEEYKRKLENWEKRFKNLTEKGAHLVGALEGDAFNYVTKLMTVDEYSQESEYDEETGEKLQESGYSKVKAMLFQRYDKRRIPKIFEAFTLLIECKRRGRRMIDYLSDLELKFNEADALGMNMSEEVKGIVAVLFAELHPSERTQALSQLQAKADDAGGKMPDYSVVTSILLSFGDSVALQGGFRPRAQLLAEAGYEAAAEHEP